MPSLDQQPYLSKSFPPRTTHGGESPRGKRKLARPIDPKRPMHVVLKADVAHGGLSMLASVKRSRKIEALIRTKARIYGVRIYQYANSGNHLHLVLKPRSRKEFQDFLRVITGQIAQVVTGAKKGLAKGKFWSVLAFSRLMSWGKDFFDTKYYVLRNAREADGIILPVRTNAACLVDELLYKRSRIKKNSEFSSPHDMGLKFR